MTVVARKYNQTMKKGCLGALFLHGILFLIAIGYIYYKPTHKLVDNYVFELVVIPDGVDPQVQSASNFEQPLEVKSLPAFVEAPEVKQVEPIPIIEIIEPAKEQSLDTPPSQDLELISQQKTIKNNQEDNTKKIDKSVKKVKKVTYKEFVKKQGAPKPNATVAKPVTQNRKKIDTQGAKLALMKSLEGKSLGGSAIGASEQETAMNRFNSALLRRIDAAWVRPSMNIVHGMSVVVEFKVSAEGKISHVNITQSSGSQQIDQSVREAFIKVGNAGKPPHSEGGVYRLRFLVEA